MTNFVLIVATVLLIVPCGCVVTYISDRAGRRRQ